MGRLTSSLSVSRVSVLPVVEEDAIEVSHLVVTYILKDRNFQLPTHALVDCGATGYAFIDEDFAHHNNLPLYHLKTPRSLEIIDGMTIESGDVSHMTKLTMTIDDTRKPFHYS